MPAHHRVAAAAVVVATLGLGAMSLLALGPHNSDGPKTPTGVPTAGLAPIQESARPLAGGLLSGTIIDSGPFGEPFTFTMPIPANSGPNEGLARQFNAAQRDLSTGVIHISGPWWTLRFVDDTPMPIDICDPASDTLPDIPSMTAAVGHWLEAEQPMRMRSWVVAPGDDVPVDGRLARRWDLLESEEDRGCGGWFGSDMLMRVYAIPTGDDTMLLIGGSDAVNFAAVSTVMDEIVRSMDFR
jgi:hypothetical protein